jgi:hypothetical protein
MGTHVVRLENSRDTKHKALSETMTSGTENEKKNTLSESIYSNSGGDFSNWNQPNKFGESIYTHQQHVVSRFGTR